MEGTLRLEVGALIRSDLWAGGAAGAAGLHTTQRAATLCHTLLVPAPALGAPTCGSRGAAIRGGRGGHPARTHVGGLST
eukprot:1139858-Pelagomonas_calceolata.AAC.10